MADSSDGHNHRFSTGAALALGLTLTLSFAGVEVVFGLWSGSLALVADAGHMLVDSAGLVLALAATLIARRPRDLSRTYGYARAEVLVVPVHVLLMTFIAGYIVYEAITRIGTDPEIEGVTVLVVGALGLGINFITLRLLRGHSHDNLNARGAMFEVFADMLGSVGVMISAVVLLATGWTGIDIIVSLVIGALVVPRAISLLRQALTILLEGAPAGTDLQAITADVMAVPGVDAVHDLHIWALAPSFVSMSAHIEVATMDGCDKVIAAAAQILRDRHGIDHVTLQPETPELHEATGCCEYPDSTPASGHTHLKPVDANP